MKSIKHISECLNNFVLSNCSWKIKLFAKWDDIIGDFGDKVKIEKIEKDILILSTTHSVWAQELYLLSDVLKKRINYVLGKNVIMDIRIRTKYLAKKNMGRKSNFKICDQSKKILNKDVVLNKSELLILDKVVDEELKNNIKEFYCCCKRGRNEERGDEGN